MNLESLLCTFQWQPGCCLESREFYSTPDKKEMIHWQQIFSMSCFKPVGSTRVFWTACREGLQSLLNLGRVGLSSSKSFYSRMGKAAHVLLQATGTLQLIFKSELPSLTEDGESTRKQLWGPSAREKRNPLAVLRKDIKALPAFTDSQVLADLKTPFYLNNLMWKENCIQVFLLATGFALLCVSALVLWRFSSEDVLNTVFLM